MRRMYGKPTFRPSETVSVNTWAFVGTNPELTLTRQPALLAKRMKRVSLKFFWKGEQFARVTGSSRPVYEIPVLLELCNLPKPLCPLLVRDSHDVGKVTRSQAAAVVN